MKAFPKIREHQDESGQDGMDLRDYFAAKAMQVILEKNYKEYYQQGSNYMPLFAEHAYSFADDMMAAREK